MRPRVAIFGWPDCYPIVYDPILLADCPYEFHFRGGCANFMEYSEKSIKMLRDGYDAVILYSVGAPASWQVAGRATALMGGHAKVALWSMDCHNPGAAEKESLFSNVFDAWFVAHSEWVPKIGGNARWMPCGLPKTVGYSKFAFVPENSLDVAFVGEPYTERDIVFERFRKYMDYWGTRYFIGTVLKDQIPAKYMAAFVVLNVNQNSDLNIRQFEAMAAGRPVLMTPAHDWKNPMFDDLRPYTVEIPRYADYDEFKAGLDQVKCIAAHPARDIVLFKHDLVHRYQAIASHLLPL
jgi:hypothetical protein